MIWIEASEARDAKSLQSIDAWKYAAPSNAIQDDAMQASPIKKKAKPKPSQAEREARAEAAGRVHLILMCHVYGPAICSLLLLLH